MSVRSPSGASAASTGSMPLPTGRLSPVSAASATSSVAAASTRPSAGTTSPASISTMSPGTSSSAGSCVERPVAAHARLDDHHLRQRRHGRRGLALLVEPEHRVEQRQQQDHDPGARLLDRIDRDHAGDQQHDLHRVPVLAQERVPARLRLRLGEAVGPVAREPLGGLGARQSALRLDVQLLDGSLARAATCQVGASVVVVAGASVAAMGAASRRAGGRQGCGLASDPSARTLTVRDVSRTSASSSLRASRFAAWSAAETSGQWRSSDLSVSTSTAADQGLCHPLVVGRDDVPRRPRRRRRRERVLEGAHVVVPASALGDVGRVELPLLARRLEPRDEAFLLHLLGDVEEELDDLRPVAVEVALEGVDVLVARLPERARRAGPAEAVAARATRDAPSARRPPRSAIG